MKDYNHLEIEKKWQAIWTKKKAYKTSNNSKKKKYYILDMIPYLSGAGLHVGHPKGYIGSDVLARMKLMQGFNVLHPMGYDAFGLPAEQYALEHNIHPRKAVEINGKTFEKQLSIIGFTYDWDRKISTDDPNFYRWTQWIFLKIYNSWYNKKTNKAEPITELIKKFEKSGSTGILAVTENNQSFTSSDWKSKTSKEKQDVLMKYRLAYEGFSEVNWCPQLGTVLANDEVIDSPKGPVSERGGFPVVKKNMRQWFMRITAYADRLLDGLEDLDWSSHIKEIQKNWIGKSEGLIFSAKVKGLNMVLETFTAHFEACYADTFYVIAPDHVLLPELLDGLPDRDLVLKKAKEMVDRRKGFAEGEYKEIDGVFTGRYVINPMGNEDLPVWVASFALANYGTGIVKCSAHDERDFSFAKKFNIPLKVTMLPTDKELARKVQNFEICFTDASTGILIEPHNFIGRNAADSRLDMVKHVTSKGFARIHTTYKMRDAIFARQRYWGEPIPLYHDKNGIIHEVSEKSLPLKLPDVKSYKPTGTGESPLAGVASWSKKGLETNTMPGWAGSSWYFLRYMDPQNKKGIADKKAIKYWKNVDMYVGGAEHATGHLLYSRFWHKFLKDYGIAITEEPFPALRNQGLIMGIDGRKMSKRWGNVVNPTDVVNSYGADTLRLYEMFMGPFEGSLPWSTDNIIGSRRFIERVWKLVERVSKKTKSDPKLEVILHKTIAKVTEDIQNFAFNTAVSAMMILSNEMDKKESLNQRDFELFLKILSPFSPHFTEEIWNKLGNKSLLVLEKWPKFDPKKMVDAEVKIAILINNKVRAEMLIPKDEKEAEIVRIAKEMPDVNKWLIGKEVKKVIYIPNRLVNFVV
ncbi:leucine--tRNA ligase [Patescibacteria group bacterium]|nr:leucine--tRNA ligase [Patescibacteria group bacterium]